MKPYIVCCGVNGRCVLYGRSELEPKHGEPIRLVQARMVLSWPSGGLLGLAASGPRGGTRLTEAVTVTETSAVTEWIAIEEQAAERIEAWPSEK